MDQRILSVCLLVVLCSMIAEHQCDDKISIEEGTTTSLSCTVPINEDKWYVAWVIQRNKRKLITVCNKNSRLENCIHENETLQDKNRILTRYNAQTYIEKGSFISNLTVLNVTAKMRKMVIWCITSATNDFDSNLISVIESYTLNVYNIPEIKSCQASKDKDNVIEVSCRFLKVYPEIICNVFPELVSRINSDVSDSHSAIKQECKVKHYDYTIAGKPYYKASCTTKYYPNKNGSYRFHVEVHVPGSPVNLTKITTNEVTVGYTNDKHMALEATEMDLKETNKAFYTLTAAFMIFGATGVVVIGWVIWSRRCISCSSASATDVGPSNEYESIQYGEAVYLLKMPYSLTYWVSGLVTGWSFTHKAVTHRRKTPLVLKVFFSRRITTWRF